MRALLARGVATILAAVAVPGIAAAAGGGVAPQTVYGKDDRREVSELTGARAAVADSVVALVSTSTWTTTATGRAISTAA